MSIEFVKGAPSELEAIVAFANDVFSSETEKTDFSSLLPKLYRNGSDTEQYHYLAKENGRIVAAVLSYPLEAVIAGRKFSVRPIGTVSVHRDYRGRGLMQALIARALEDMEREGVAFTLLSGQRQRYEYFGYEPCMQRLSCTVTRDNLRHAFPGLPTGRVSLRPLAPGDTELLQAAHRLQERRPFYVLRPGRRFYDICCSWNARPFAVLKDGAFAGYLVASPDGAEICELELSDASALPELLARHLAFFGRYSAELLLAPFETGRMAALDAFCDGMTAGISESLHIFSYPDLIRQLLLLKASYAPLRDGTLVFGIGERVRFRIAVAGEKIAVDLTDEPADFSLPEFQALRFLFSAVSPLYTYEPHALPGCAASWFPLPFYWPPADQV